MNKSLTIFRTRFYNINVHGYNEVTVCYNKHLFYDPLMSVKIEFETNEFYKIKNCWYFWAVLGLTVTFNMYCRILKGQEKSRWRFGPETLGRWTLPLRPWLLGRRRWTDEFYHHGSGNRHRNLHQGVRLRHRRDRSSQSGTEPVCWRTFSSLRMIGLRSQKAQIIKAYKLFLAKSGCFEKRDVNKKKF